MTHATSLPKCWYLVASTRTPTPASKGVCCDGVANGWDGVCGKPVCGKPVCGMPVWGKLVWGIPVWGVLAGGVLVPVCNGGIWDWAGLVCIPGNVCWVAFCAAALGTAMGPLPLAGLG